MRPSSPRHLSTPLFVMSAFVAIACRDTPVQPPALNLAASLAAERPYREIDLAPMTLPAAINSAGKVAGDCRTADDAPDGCVWENGRVTYFGGMRVFFGMPLEDYDVLNDAGQVIGLCKGPGEWQEHACMWDRAHGLTDLGAGPGSAPVAINATGDVVGVRALSWNAGFLWRNGVLTELDFEPRGINARGQVVGMRDKHAVLWDNGDIADLGTLGGDYGDAIRINAAGNVAGMSGDGHVFLWNHGMMLDLGRGGSVIEHIDRPVQLNARSQVVSNDYEADGVPGAWVWERGTRTLLSSLKGPRTYQAAALSATGMITGWFMDPPCPSPTRSDCNRGRPFVSDGQTVIDLPTVLPGGWGLSVNSAGQVVGLEGGRGVLWTR